MAILQRIARNIDNRFWSPGLKGFPVKNRYTAGVAGQKFFKKIKEKGQIYGSRCEKCSITYVPARIYCERCFNQLEEKDWLEVGNKGTLYSFTVIHFTKSGEPKQQPSIIGAVRIADGLLFHHLDECRAEDLKIGMPVQAELVPLKERKGGLGDIKYFKPL